MSLTQPAPLRTAVQDRTTIGLAVAAVLCSLPLLGLGALAWVETAGSSSDDPLVGLGYVIAVVAAAPGVLAVLLAALGVALRRRYPVGGIVLTAVALGIAALPLAFTVFWIVPMPMV